MSTTIENGGTDPQAATSEQVAPTTSIPYKIGELTSDSALVRAPPIGELTRYQTYPDTSLGDFLTRPVEIAQINLASTDPVLSKLPAFLPWDLFLANPAVQAKTSTFSYIHGVLQVILVCAVPGNAFGSYVLSAVPNADADLTGDYVFTPYKCLQTDIHARIDMSASENVVLELPWVWPYDVADLAVAAGTSTQHMWTVFVSCLAPLQTAIPGGVSTGHIRVYAALLPGYELIVPRFQGFTHTPATRSLGVRATPATVTAHPESSSLGPVSKVSHAVGKIAEALSGVPVIGQFAGAAAVGAGFVTDVASWLGFTRGATEAAPHSMTMRSFTNVARTDGDDPGEAGVLAGDALISIDPRLAGACSDDQLSLASFFSRWTCIGSFTWKPTDLTNSTIGFFPVSPYASSGTSLTYDMVTAGYYGIPFSYWRADMEYLLILPVSKLHRGTLQVVWNNSGDNSVVPPITNLAMNVIIDVSSGGDHVFQVGYAQDVPFLPSYIFHVNDAIIPIGTCNGALSFVVVNPLESQNTAVNVTGLLFARATSTAQFVLPRSNLPPSGGTGVRDIETSVNYQGASGDEDSHPLSTHALVPLTQAIPVNALYFPAETVAPRALMQKPTRMARLWNSAFGLLTTDMYPQHFVNPPGPTTITTGAELTNEGFGLTFSWVSHFGICFVGIASSVRWKLTPAAPAWAYVCATYQPTVLTPAVLQPLAPTTFCGPNNGAEFLVPYDFPRKFICLFAQRLNSFLPSPTRRTNIHVQDSSNLNVPASFYYSAGPDVRVAPFRFVPSVSLANHFGNPQTVNQSDIFSTYKTN